MRRAVASLLLGDRIRLTIRASTILRTRVGRVLMIVSSFSRRSIPSAAATGPWGQALHALVLRLQPFGDIAHHDASFEHRVEFFSDGVWQRLYR